MIIHRASDHIENRLYYRQIRDYELSGFKESYRIGQDRVVDGVHFEYGYADINCTTAGYYRMKDFGNMADAVRVEVSGVPRRAYKNKAVLRIRLEGISQKARHTLAVILNELFVTLYPDDWEYLAAVAYNENQEGASPYTGYSYSGEPDDCVYIIEDCRMDLGLLASVERNIIRYLEIITDFLAWHKQMLQTPDVEEAEAAAQTEAGGFLFTPEEKESLLKRIVNKIKGWFKRKKKRPEEEADEDEALPVIDIEELVADAEQADSDIEDDIDDAEQGDEQDEASAEPDAADTPAGEPQEEPEGEAVPAVDIEELGADAEAGGF